jgi:hypothetical protein
MVAAPLAPLAVASTVCFASPKSSTFTCPCRVIHEQWFHEHIIQRKQEIEWLAEPVEEIKRALITATEVRWQPEYQRPLYVGPFIGHGF